jgi:hypothetical protein
LFRNNVSETLVSSGSKEKLLIVHISFGFERSYIPGKYIISAGTEENFLLEINKELYKLPPVSPT